MTIAFLIHSHKNVAQIARLCGTIKQGLPDSFITVSHNGSPAELQQLAGLPSVNRAVPALAGRAQFGMIDALLAELRRLEAAAQPYQWMVILSGQDYPIRPLAEMAEELAASADDAYFHHFDADEARAGVAHMLGWTEIATRYHYHHRLLADEATPWMRAAVSLPRRLLNQTNVARIHTAFGLTVGKPAQHPPFGPDFRLHCGMAWMTFSQRAARSILRFIEQRPQVADYFRKTLAPDEAFLQSIMANDPELRLNKKELRYIDFGASKLSQAKLLGADDLPRMAESGCFFARKFDTSRDPDILDRVDALLQRPRPSRPAVQPALIDTNARAPSAPAQRVVANSPR